MADRDFVRAAQAARQSFARAAEVGLTVRQYRVLSAVVSLTALYSRLEDRVYLAQVAALAFGATEAKPWMLKKTREALNELDALGIVSHTAPVGRPNMSDGSPRYVVRLPRSVQETDPDPGVDSSGTDPDPGVSSEEKVTPDLDRNGPRFRTESDPGSGPPTGEYYGETSATTAAADAEASSEDGKLVDREVRRRIRDYEARTGQYAGPGLRAKIRREVESDIELDLDLETADVGDRELDAKITAARSFGARFARSYDRQEFMDLLGHQRDWAKHPEVIDAAIATFKAVQAEAVR